MLRIVLVSLALLAADPALGQVEAPVQLDAQLNNLVQLLAGGRAVEFRSARRYHFLDVNADGVPDAAAFFTLETLGQASQASVWFALLVAEPFPQSGQRLRPPAFRLVDFIQLAPNGAGRVNVDALAYDKGAFGIDTDKGKIVLRLQGGRLLEAKP
jgi:hypothetical protein